MNQDGVFFVFFKLTTHIMPDVSVILPAACANKISLMQNNLLVNMGTTLKSYAEL